MVAAGRSTVVRESSASAGSGRRNTLGSDRPARRPTLPNAFVSCHDERLDAAVRPDEQVAQLSAVATTGHDGTAEELAQRPGALAVEAEIFEQQEGRPE